jgi:pimeloyl-ACP methyl ester carboxylesterase
MSLTHKTLSHDGVTLHYWTGGQPDAPLVVFTHGATIDHHEWDATLPLVAERFRVLAWDIRGHGLSRPAPFSMPAAVADLLAILDAERVEQAVLVGHSLGGNLHQELVFQHPERVLGLACVDCTWNFQKLSRSDRFWLSIAEPMFKLYPARLLVEQSLQATSTLKSTQDQLRPAMQSHTKADFARILLAATACLHEDPGYVIGKPLLLILGDEDPTGNIRKAMPAWAAVEPDCRLIIIPGVRHAPNLDVPDLFHRELLAFLNRFL